MAVEIKQDDAPGTYTRETDETGGNVTPLGSRNVAIVGLFEKGAINRRVKITSQEELIKQFGYGNQSKLGNDWYTAYDLLEETDSMTIMRVMGSPATDGEKFKYASLTITDDGSTTTKGIDEVSTSDVLSSELLPTGKGNSEDFILPIEQEVVATGSLLVASNIPTLDANLIGIKLEGNDKDIVVVNPDWTGTPISVNVGDLYKVANQVWEVSVAGVVANAEPSWEVNAVIGDIIVDGAVTWTLSDEDMHKDILGLKDKYPLSWYKMHKLSVFTKGSTTETFGSIAKETFYVTFDESIATSGKPLNINEVVNGNSNYIYVKSEIIDDVVDRTTYDGLANDIDTTALGGGQTGNFTSSNAEYIKEMIAGWGFFKSREYSSWNLACSSTDADTDATFQIAKKMNSIAEMRQGAMTTAQCDKVSDVRTEQVLKTSIPAFSGLSNDSRTSFYAGFDRRFDPFKGKRIYLPKSIEGARAILKASRLKSEAEAPAGEDYAICKGFDQNVIWDAEDVGTLYAKNINVSTNKKGQNVIWGQKTAKRVDSALNRINVRRIMDVIGIDLEQQGDVFIWKGINNKLIEKIYSYFDRYLGTKSATFFDTREDAGYRIVITPDGNNRNRVNVRVEVKPISTLEWLAIEFVVTENGITQDNA